MAGFDPITLALAKKYTDEKAGYAEKPVLTYDGKGDNFHHAYDTGLRYARISNEALDLKQIVKATVSLNGGERIDITAKDMTIADDWLGNQVAYASIGAMKAAGILSVKEKVINDDGTGVDKGLYVLSEEIGYISYVEFAETIHTIDPKFLPKGGVGHEEKHKVVANSRDFDNSEFTVMGVGFSLVSPLMPTKEELAGGKIIIRLYNSTAEEQLECTIGDVLFDDEMVYGGKLHAGNIHSSCLVAIAYKTGEWAAAGETIDKTGIYIHFPDMEEGISTELTFEWETIHTIDPKFIPGVCLPVVELETFPNTVDDFAQLNAKESTIMDEVLSAGSDYVLVSFRNEGSGSFPITNIFRRFSNDEGATWLFGGWVNIRNAYIDGMMVAVGSPIAIAKSPEDNIWLVGFYGGV